MPPKRNTERDMRMLAMYEQGYTLADIGIAFGISKQVVRQSISRYPEYKPRAAKRNNKA